MVGGNERGSWLKTLVTRTNPKPLRHMENSWAPIDLYASLCHVTDCTGQSLYLLIFQRVLFKGSGPVYLAPVYPASVIKVYLMLQYIHATEK